MKSAVDIGTNRTGIATSPIDGPQVISGAEQAGSSSSGDESAQAAVRAAYVKESSPVGTVPPPASVKGAVKTIAQALKGDKASVFIDKLGERLAFERAGVRLYALAILKAEAGPGWDGSPSVSDLTSIQRDELEHFGMLLGSARTSRTPLERFAATSAHGVMTVGSAPISFAQAINIPKCSSSSRWIAVRSETLGLPSQPAPACALTIASS